MGFCLTYNQFLKLKKEKYYVNIDSSFKDGILNYGEIVIKGKSEKRDFYFILYLSPFNGK